MRIHINRVTVATVIAIQAIWPIASGHCRQPAPDWGRAILGTRVLPVNGPQLDVGGIGEESGRLYGRCIVANVLSGSYKPVRLIVEGRWCHGQFWATAVSQVGDFARGPWRTISIQSKKRDPVRVVVEPGSILSDFRVDLEPFRRYIGKYHVGRVVLSSGDGGVFELNDLVPPVPPDLPD